MGPQHERGAADSTVERDTKALLAVRENSGATKVFENVIEPITREPHG